MSKRKAEASSSSSSSEEEDESDSESDCLRERQEPEFAQMRSSPRFSLILFKDPCVLPTKRILKFVNRHLAACGTVVVFTTADNVSRWLQSTKQFQARNALFATQFKNKDSEPPLAGLGTPVNAMHIAVIIHRAELSSTWSKEESQVPFTRVLLSLLVHKMLFFCHGRE